MPFEPAEKIGEEIFIGPPLYSGDNTAIFYAGTMDEVVIKNGMGLDDIPYDLAVKCLSRAALLGDRLRGRFSKECEISTRLSALRDDVFVTVRKVLLTLGGIRECLVLELLEGRTLARAVDNEEIDKSDFPEILRIAAGIAIGLDVMDGENIVMRDLTPNNIMLEINGRVRLIDFGFAIIDGNDPFRLDGCVVGTPAYMSPEACMDGKLDARADLYSLGVIIYNMLMGHVPIMGADPMEILMNQVCEDPYPLDDTVPAEIQDLVYRLLAKDFVYRPRTAKVVGRKIVEIMKNLIPEDELKNYSEFVYFMNLDS
jgi:serine/threonine protein kinase